MNWTRSYPTVRSLHSVGLVEMINSRAVEELETSREKIERVPDLSFVSTGARFLNPVRVRNL